MIRLEKVNGNNVWDLLKLRVSEEQKTLWRTMTSVLLRHIPL